MSLYSLRHANRSVKLAALLFLLVLGFAYGFAFLMVKTWSGLTRRGSRQPMCRHPGWTRWTWPASRTRRRSHWT
jgi:hypothetical protein